MNMKKQVIGIKNSKNPPGIFSNFPLGIKNIILITLILTLLIVGCQKVEEKEVEAETPDISIESDVAEIDSIDEDLGLGELENLEGELDEINW